MTKSMKSIASAEPSSVQISILISEIRCTSFELTPYGRSNKKAISFDGYEFQFVLNLDVFEPQKNVQVRADIRLYEKQAEGVIKQQIAELKSIVLFSVVNFNDVIRKNNANGFDIQNSLIQFCFSTSLGAIRGMYNIKLENTLYSNAILPLVNIQELIINNNHTKFTELPQ